MGGGEDVLAPAGAAGDVLLVREFKGPRLQDFLEAPAQLVDALPGMVHTMHEVAAAGDYRAAERHLDHAVGLLLQGPGHRRRAWRTWRQVAAWVALLALIAALLWVAASP